MNVKLLAALVFRSSPGSSWHPKLGWVLTEDHEKTGEVHMEFEHNSILAVALLTGIYVVCPDEDVTFQIS